MSGGPTPSDPGPESADPEQPAPAEEAGLYPIEPRYFVIAFYLLIALWAAYLLSEAITYDRIADFFFPYLLLGLLAVLLVVKLTQLVFPEVMRSLAPTAESSAMTPANVGEVEIARSKRKQELYELRMVAWVVALPFIMYYFGIGWAAVVYTFGFVWYFLGDVKLAALTTVVVVAFVVALFLNVLNMVIWDGVLGLPDPLRVIDSLIPL